MVVNKIGFLHMDEGKNNQDYYYSQGNISMVMDGCSEGLHSEVGVKLFSQLFSKQPFNDDPELFESNVHQVFEQMLSIFNDIPMMFNNLCFTIIACFKLEDKFIVKACGDGFIITQGLDNSINYIRIDNGAYPKYWVYNYIPADSLIDYKDGVSFDTFEYSKEKFSCVGVASDGLRYVNDLPNDEQFRLQDYLIRGKPAQIKMLINRNSLKFKDDITICF